LICSLARHRIAGVDRQLFSEQAAETPMWNMPVLHSFTNLDYRAQDAQEGQTSHPPNPGGYFTRPP